MTHSRNSTRSKKTKLRNNRKESAPEAEAAPEDRLSAKLGALEAELSPTALRVARYLNRNRVLVLTNSAAELAANIGTSDATVVRTAVAWLPGPG